MPTLNDLRATLHDRADLCDAGMLDTLVTIDRPSHSPRRRRVLTPLLAAAAVVATVGAGAAVGTALHHDTAMQAAGPLAAPRPAPTWRFTIADVPGWTVSYDVASWLPGGKRMPGGWQELATLTPAHGQATATYAYEPNVQSGYPGNGMGGNIADGRAVAVTINGERGWWAPGRAVDTSSMTPAAVADPWAAVKSGGDWQPELVWKNSDGSWNQLMGTVGFQPKTFSFDNAVARRAMMRIAKAVALTSWGGPVTLPFSARLGDRYQLSDVRLKSGADCGEWFANPSADGLMICRVTAGQQRSARLNLAGNPDETVARRDLGDGTVLVTVLYGDARHHLDGANVLDSLDVSPKLDDRSTWLPAGS